MSSYFKATKEDVDRLREEYPEGTRVRLLEMTDPYQDIPVGTLGTVKCVDDIGTVHVSWDGYCRLGLVYDVDKYEKVQDEKKKPSMRVVTIKRVIEGKEEVIELTSEDIRVAHEAFVKTWMESEISQSWPECPEEEIPAIAERAYDIYSEGNGYTEYESIEKAIDERE